MLKRQHFTLNEINVKNCHSCHKMFNTESFDWKISKFTLVFALKHTSIKKPRTLEYKIPQSHNLKLFICLKMVTLFTNKVSRVQIK